MEGPSAARCLGYLPGLLDRRDVGRQVLPLLGSGVQLRLHPLQLLTMALAGGPVRPEAARCRQEQHADRQNAFHIVVIGGAGGGVKGGGRFWPPPGRIPW